MATTITRERNESAIQTDITIYGATSFVARHVLNYLVDVGPTLPRKVHVTLAGRNGTKLNKVLSTFVPLIEQATKKSGGGSDHGGGMSLQNDVIVASSTDSEALLKMAERTRVVLNCAGPFELYSGGVVAACAAAGCDYVDITGEVGWVGDMRVRYGPTAAKSGARIISLCGFDSIPSDMAIFAAVQALRLESSSASQNSNNTTTTDSNNDNDNNGNTTTVKPIVEIETARTWHSTFGVAGGGTLVTMKNMDIGWRKCLFHSPSSLRKVPLLLFDPLVLTNPQAVRFNPDYDDTRDRMAWSEWLNWLLPCTPHSIFKQGVSIPFFMAVCNAKVVQASAVALKYGPQFTYQERFLPLGFDTTIGFGLFSTIPSLVVLWFLAMGGILLQLPVISDWLLRVLAPPGTGASDAMCQRGYAHVYAEVKTAPFKGQPQAGVDVADVSSSSYYSCANCYMAFQGDPGNFVTAQCVVESALALVLNRKELPTRSQDGFGTPAELLGPVLLMRLQDTKVRPVVVKTSVRLNNETRSHENQVYM